MSDVVAGELTGELEHRTAVLDRSTLRRSLAVTPDRVASDFGALRPDAPLRHLPDLRRHRLVHGIPPILKGEVL